MALIEDDTALRRLLERTRTIAVLGIKAGEADDAYRVPRYMQATGHRILPISPKLLEVLGEPAVARMLDLDQPFDLLDVFRDARHLPTHVDEVRDLRLFP